MTNIIWAITLVTITNWTGHMVGTNELGYIATNHSLTVNYNGTDHKFTLLSEPGNVAVWRPQDTTLQWLKGATLTNYYPWVIPMPTNIYPNPMTTNGPFCVPTLTLTNMSPWTTNEAVIPTIRMKDWIRTNSTKNAKGQAK
jgi:hypothetical protein